MEDFDSLGEMSCDLQATYPENVIRITVSIKDANGELKQDYLILDETVLGVTVDSQLDAAGTKILQEVIDKFIEERMFKAHENNSN